MSSTATKEASKMVGIAINASRQPAVKTLSRSSSGKKGTQAIMSSCDKLRMASPKTTTPKNPMTTEGIAETNSM